MTPTTIHHLPEELLIKIFLHLSNPLEDCSYNFDLAGVSRQWAAIVFNTPLLWTNIHSTQSEPGYRTALKRSKESPLDIVYREQPYRPEESARAFVAAICEEAGRWRSIRVEVNGQPSNAVEWFFRTLPKLPATVHLETLCIECNLAGQNRASLEDAFNGQTPRLRHLSITGLPILWNSRLLRNLQTLKLSYLDILGPSASQVAKILQDCPKLVELNLDFPESDTTPVPNDLSIISLPQLLGLDITLSPKTTEYILKRVRVPKCERLVVRDMPWDRASNLLSDELGHMVPILKRALQAATRVWLSIGGIFHFIASTEPRHKTNSRLVELRISEPSVNEISWLLHKVPYDKQDLAIVIHLWSIEELNAVTRILDELSTSSNVTSLILQERENREAVLLYLSQPMTKHQQWPLPTLREISFVESEGLTPEDLVNLVEKRRGGTLEPETVQRLRRNEELKSIRFNFEEVSWKPEDVPVLAGILQNR